MNKTTVRHFVFTAILGFAVWAILSTGLSPVGWQSASKFVSAIPSHHGTLIADGSESNGGKGGGKGNSIYQSVA
jgi:hypothetical protein